MSVYIYQTVAGALTVHRTSKKIYQASFVDATDTLAPITRIPRINKTQLLLQGTDFQIEVWKKIVLIPAGKTATYQELAIAIGKPKAWRAVANAVANNKIAYFIPCHRVIRKNGAIGGYKWGTAKKKALLKAENALIHI